MQEIVIIEILLPRISCINLLNRSSHRPFRDYISDHFITAPYASHDLSMLRLEGVVFYPADPVLQHRICKVLYDLLLS